MGQLVDGKWSTDNVLVHRVDVGHDDVARIVVDANCKDLSRFRRVAPHSLDPLPRWQFVQRHNNRSVVNSLRPRLTSR